MKWATRTSGSESDACAAAVPRIATTAVTRDNDGHSCLAGSRRPALSVIGAVVPKAWRVARQCAPASESSRRHPRSGRASGLVRSTCTTGHGSGIEARVSPPWTTSQVCASRLGRHRRCVAVRMRCRERHDHGSSRPKVVNNRLDKALELAARINGEL